MIEYEISTNRANRDLVTKSLEKLGEVIERWVDDTINFGCTDNDCVKKMTDLLDKLGVEYKLF